METADYFIAWSIYLLCAGAVSIIIWKMLRRYVWRELAYLVQFVGMAVVFTPWYVLPEEEILAPAIFVFLLDLITIDVTTSIRSLIPLVMAILLGVVLAVVMSTIYRVRRRRDMAPAFPSVEESQS